MDKEERKKRRMGSLIKIKGKEGRTQRRRCRWQMRDNMK